MMMPAEHTPCGSEDIGKGECADINCSSSELKTAEISAGQRRRGDKSFPPSLTDLVASASKNRAPQSVYEHSQHDSGDCWREQRHVAGDPFGEL